MQHKQKDTLPAAAQWWNIGVKPVTPVLPVSTFRGLIPEIFAYGRVLSSRERLQVASYLALKYGITLTEPGATYLNSAGATGRSNYYFSGALPTAGIYELVWIWKAATLFPGAEAVSE